MDIWSVRSGCGHRGCEFIAHGTRLTFAASIGSMISHHWRWSRNPSNVGAGKKDEYMKGRVTCWFIDMEGVIPCMVLTAFGAALTLR